MFVGIHALGIPSPPRVSDGHPRGPGDPVNIDRDPAYNLKPPRAHRCRPFRKLLARRRNPLPVSSTSKRELRDLDGWSQPRAGWAVEKTLDALYTTKLNNRVRARAARRSPRGTAPRGTAPRGTAAHGTAAHGKSSDQQIPAGTAPRGTAAHGTAVHGSAPRATARHGTRCAAQPSMARAREAQPRTEAHGTSPARHTRKGGERCPASRPPRNPQTCGGRSVPRRSRARRRTGRRTATHWDGVAH